MKSLTEILQAEIVNPDDLTEEEYFDRYLENYYNPYVKYQEKIYESILHSYDPNKLLKTLQREFGEDVIKRKDSGGGYDPNIGMRTVEFVCSVGDEKRILNSNQFKSILNLFNYTYTKSTEIERNGHKMKRVTLEPNITDDYTKTVYDIWNGVVYHVTLKEYEESILKNGLRPKSAKEIDLKRGIKYRNFDERIFLTGGPDWKHNLLMIIGGKGFTNQKFTIFRIDLKKNRHKIRLFKDPMSTSCLGIYTKEPIYKECLTVIDVNELMP